MPGILSVLLIGLLLPTILFPDPAAVNPVIPAVALTVQLKIAPVTSEVSATALLLAPEHIVWATGFAVAWATG